MAPTISSDDTLCPTCSAPLVREACGDGDGDGDGVDGPAVCAACLLRGALTPAPAPLPRMFGRYELVGLLGRGGMGVVYRARDAVGREVALKTLRDRDADAADVARFIDEARKAAELRDDGIVRVLDVGEVPSGAGGAQPYFTMELIDGGSLAQRLEEFRGAHNQRKSAKLVADIARAIHHAHQRLVLHRDLKPANVLLDAAGKPHIADFGVARRLDAESISRSGDALVGTLHYMAPEQIATPDDLTVAVDVYAMGCILYELLRGRPPVDGSSPAELIRNIANARPAPLVDIDRDLATICMKCLEKQRDDRYASASAVAADLERYLRDEPIAARRWSRRERAVRALRRHPTIAVLSLAALLLLVFVAAVAVQVARAQEAELRADALDVNAYAARALSGAVLFELDALADRARVLAADPGVRATLAADDDDRARVSDQWRSSVSPEPFDSLLVLDDDGRWLARAPAGDLALVDDDFGWRDYHHGAAALGRAKAKNDVYVSRAYESLADGTVRFSMSVPLFDESGAFIGVFQAAIATADALGALSLDDPDEDARLATIVARRDRDRPDEAMPDDWFIVVHEGVSRGSKHLVANRGALAQIGIGAAGVNQLVTSTSPPLRDEDHRDPIAGFGGRWLAGVAPVGGTHFAVIVQTRGDAVIGPNERLGRRLAAAAIAALLAALVFGGLLYAWDRARRSRTRAPT